MTVEPQRSYFDKHICNKPCPDKGKLVLPLPQCILLFSFYVNLVIGLLCPNLMIITLSDMYIFVS